MFEKCQGEAEPQVLWKDFGAISFGRPPEVVGGLAGERPERRQQGRLQSLSNIGAPSSDSGENGATRTRELSRGNRFSSGLGTLKIDFLARIPARDGHSSSECMLRGPILELSDGRPCRRRPGRSGGPPIGLQKDAPELTPESAQTIAVTQDAAKTDYGGRNQATRK